MELALGHAAAIADSIELGMAVLVAPLRQTTNIAGDGEGCSTSLIAR